MKLEKVEHDHKLTNILKIALFALLMIMPFLACLPSITYFAFNKHAENYTNQTITETYEYETNEINSVDDLVNGNIYQFSVNTLEFSEYLFYDGDYGSNFFSIVDYNLSNIITFSNQSSYLGFSYESNNLSYDYLSIKCTLVGNNYDITIVCDDYNDTYSFYAHSGLTYTDDFLINFYIICIDKNAFENIGGLYASDYLGEKTTTIDESEMNPLSVFYTANEQVWEQPLFNWVNNGLFANSLGAFIGVFGIAQNSYFNNLLTYWLVLIIIYIIIDLILGLFTLITHIICNRKVKE